MTPMEREYSRLVKPVLSTLEPRYQGPRATIMLLTIGQVESAWTARDQGDPTVPGPARGFFQFELGGGVPQVMQGAPEDLKKLMRVQVKQANQVWAPKPFWYLLGTSAGDALAVLAARALLWLNPKSLPEIGRQRSAFEYYKEQWRPGKPSYSRWRAAYPQALALVRPDQV